MKGLVAALQWSKRTLQEKMMQGQQPATVGAQTQLKGTLEGAEDLTVAGRIEGRLRLGETLTVESTGVVVADVEARRVIVSGTIVGDVVASELVHITAQGRVAGDLYAPRLILAEGGGYRGTINMDGKTPPRPGSRKAAAEQRATPSGRSGQPSRGAALQKARAAKSSRPPTAAGRKSRVKRK